MSEKLLEANFISINTSKWDRPDMAPAAGSEEPTIRDDTPTSIDSSSESAEVPRGGGSKTTMAGTSKDNWKKELLKLSDRFNPKVIKQLEALGEYFVQSLKVLGYNITKENGGNPILAFMAQKWVQDELLAPGLLNMNTFKAIYNAVANNLVADSEFFENNDYNLIYCKALYNKTPAEMQDYLKLQRDILSVSQSGTYSDEAITKNKKVFLYIDSITELDLIKRAKAINKPGIKPVDSVVNAKLNSLKLARQIAGISGGNTIPVSADKQDKLVNALDNRAKIFAALMSLSVSTNNKKARTALSNALFRGVGAEAVAEATSWLIANNILPKGQIQDTDADELVTKILAKLSTL